MNLGVFIYRYNPEHWKWMLPKDSVKVQKEGKGHEGRCVHYMAASTPSLALSTCSIHILGMKKGQRRTS